MLVLKFFFSTNLRCYVDKWRMKKIANDNLTDRLNLMKIQLFQYLKSSGFLFLLHFSKNLKPKAVLLSVRKCIDLLLGFAF